MNLLRSTAIAALTAFGLVSTAHADTVLEFKDAGWSVGDNASGRNAEGLKVSFVVKERSEPGQVYVHTEFCNTRSGEWFGRVNITTTYPENAPFVMKLDPGECTKRGRQVEQNATVIYVFVDEY